MALSPSKYALGKIGETCIAGFSVIPDQVRDDGEVLSDFDLMNFISILKASGDAGLLTFYEAFLEFDNLTSVILGLDPRIQQRRVCGA